MGKRSQRHRLRQARQREREAAPVLRLQRTVAEHGKRLVRSDPLRAAGMVMTRRDAEWPEQWREVEELDWAIAKLREAFVDLVHPSAAVCDMLTTMMRQRRKLTEQYMTRYSHLDLTVCTLPKDWTGCNNGQYRPGSYAAWSRQ